jgi:nucleotide-binding universal stress UspA family protein
MGTIVVGYVAKPEGDAALKRAIEEAKLRGSKLVVVNSHRGGDDFDGTASRQADQAIEQVKAQLVDSGVEHEVRQLIGIAETADADLIVIGLRRRSPVGKLILGSNAQRILLDAQCPVLAVKAE